MCGYNGLSHTFTHLYVHTHTRTHTLTQRYLAPDARIAWGEFVFPEELFQGEAVEEWVALSGSQGEEKEGALNIILSYMVGVCVCVCV